MDALITAIQFLTILPLRTAKMSAKNQLGRAAGWFSYVGVLIGLITAGAFYTARIVFPDMLAAVLTLSVWILLSGGLHLDGVADCCDALFVSADKKRRLEIMQDPRHGTFGILGLVLLILFKLAALYTLYARFDLFVLPFACALSRWLLLPAGRMPAARPGGLGERFSAELRNMDLIWGFIPVIVLAYLIGWVSIPIFILVCAFTFLLLAFARKQLGGITGDVLGFVVELSETMALIAFCVNFAPIQ